MDQMLDSNIDELENLENMHRQHVDTKNMSSDDLKEITLKTLSLGMDIHSQEVYHNLIQEEINELKPEVAHLESICEIKKLQLEHKIEMSLMYTKAIDRTNEIIATKEMALETLQQNYKYIQKRNKEDEIKAKQALASLENVQLEAERLFEQDPLFIKRQQMKNTVLQRKIMLDMMLQRIREQKARNTLMQSIRARQKQLDIIEFAQAMVNSYKKLKERAVVNEKKAILENGTSEKEIQEKQHKLVEIRKEKYLDAVVFKVPFLLSLTPEDNPIRSNLKRRQTEPDHSQIYKKQFSDLNQQQIKSASKISKQISNISIKHSQKSQMIIENKYPLSTNEPSESKLTEITNKLVDIPPMQAIKAPAINIDFIPKEASCPPIVARAPELVSQYFINNAKPTVETSESIMIVENYESQNIIPEEMTFLSSNSEMHTAPNDSKQPSEVSLSTNDVDMIPVEHCHNPNETDFNPDNESNINQDYGNLKSCSTLSLNNDELLQSPKSFNSNYISPEMPVFETAEDKTPQQSHSLFHPKPPQSNKFTFTFGRESKPESTKPFFNMF